MDKPTSDMYKMAISDACAIPDGIARGFRRQIRQFKMEYRQQRDDRLAAQLIKLQHGGGGFIRGDNMC